VAHLPKALAPVYSLDFVNDGSVHTCLPPRRQWGLINTLDHALKIKLFRETGEEDKQNQILLAGLCLGSIWTFKRQSTNHSLLFPLNLTGTKSSEGKLPSFLASFPPQQSWKPSSSWDSVCLPKWPTPLASTSLVTSGHYLLSNSENTALLQPSQVSSISNLDLTYMCDVWLLKGFKPTGASPRSLSC
jgi:hypothetical protein